MTISVSGTTIKKYWDVTFEPDFSRSEDSFIKELKEILKDSISENLISDVPIGAYLSGGYDSSAIASIANVSNNKNDLIGFTGKFSKYGSRFDESSYAREVALNGKFEIKELEITSQNFLDNIQKVIYHLDYPVAGPGSFSQFMISEHASKYRKVDAILSMYHDQGLVAFKALSFGSGVNYTGGLPIIRTSPDHGTAYDIAGKNEANPGSIRSAIYLAIDSARLRKQYAEDRANPVKKVELKERRGRRRD